ncbi:VanZ family protein [Arsukibacterium perlucidum]|uniref:VanZ family protein n=1 Tax=Arsukibacterium perlucidum TaxID=368811 RepID=UPI0003A516DF|nr:VanZ family protein [Arsukibacterium perlucidum]
MHNTAPHLAAQTGAITAQATLQNWLLLSLIVYLAFVIYGSLVPLHYVGISLDEAIQRYSQIRYLDLGIQSRADWVANILLFIPLAFLLAAVSFKVASPLRNLVLALVIQLLCTSLAFSIEFIQLFFPQRTVSINDIIAESLGAFSGISLYLLFGERFKQFMLAAALMRGKASVFFYLLLGYTSLFFLYQILPLDLTLSPIELYKKWQDGRIVLLPFSAYKGSMAEITYAVVSDIVLWLPIALLWQLHKPQQSKLVFYSRIALLAIVLEFCQLFVYSRVTDISDVLCALLAALLSRYMLSFWRQYKGQAVQGCVSAPDNTPFSRSLLWLGAVLFYSFFILLLFWYPFDFNFDWAFINQRWQLVKGKVLLESLYFGTEYRAITALAQKILLFLPLGVLFALAWQAQRESWQRKASAIIGLLYITGLAAFSEAMQLALPGKTVDSTDVLLQIMGAGIGFTGYLFLQRRATRPAAENSTATAAAIATVQTNRSIAEHKGPPWLTRAQRKPLLLIAIHLAVTVLALLLIGELPLLPYNVRELLTDSSMAAVGLSLMFYLMSLPLLLRVKQFAVFALWLPLLVLLQSTLIFWLLYLTVPTESLYDILGAPVTSLPQSLELMLRFIGLFSLIQLNYLFAGRLVQEQNKLPALIIWAIFSLLFAVIWYLAVIKLAATDNITELLANGGSYGSALGLSLYLALLFGAAAYLGRYFAMPQRRRFWWLCIVILLAFGLSWLLLNTITESLIVKYQQVFSAMQFLLSSNRANYAAPDELMLRYAIGHSAILILLAWFYALAQRLNPQPGQALSCAPGLNRMRS